jgi:adenosine deaminase CECR1
MFPGLMSGMDLVNEEDGTPPILDFIKELLNAKDENVPFLLHAGETNEKKNSNLYDSILLGTKRIGHGFDIIKVRS